MRKLFVFNMMTLDGYFEDPNHELDWHNVDEEFNKFAIKQLNEVDTLLFGRVTYQMMADYWTTQTAITDDPIVAGKMNSLSKVVVSKTMTKADWNNSKVISNNVTEQIAALKNQQGKDIVILGSAELISTLINHGLIDEFRIMINPLILGSGRPLFKDMKERLSLKLLDSKSFRSGNVLLFYGLDY